MYRQAITLRQDVEDAPAKSDDGRERAGPLVGGGIDALVAGERAPPQ
jgi:hypothetical protein